MVGMMLGQGQQVLQIVGRNHCAYPGAGHDGNDKREQDKPARRWRGEQGGDAPGNWACTGVGPFTGAGEDGAEHVRDYAARPVCLGGHRGPADRWLLGLGIAATLAANVAHGLGDGLTGAAVKRTRYRNRRPTCSLSSLRRTGFRRFARSALSFTSASYVHNVCGISLP